MQSINNSSIKGIVSFLNKKLDSGDSSPITYNDIETIVNKPKLKLKIKPKENDPIINKPNRLKIKKKKDPDPGDFDDEYQYFIQICSILKKPYYLYKTTLWSGPALIIPIAENTDNKIKDRFKINTSIDILPYSMIAIYPFTTIKDDRISYKNIYKPEPTKLTQIELTEWKHEQGIFYIDKTTNYVYDTLNKLYIGERDFINNRWVINN